MHICFIESKNMTDGSAVQTFLEIPRQTSEDWPSQHMKIKDIHATFTTHELHTVFEGGSTYNVAQGRALVSC